VLGKMRAEVAGAQIEGTPEELASFLRLYSQPEAQRPSADDGRLICGQCARSYGLKDSLEAHMRKKHGIHKRQKRQERGSKKLRDTPDPDPKLDKLEKDTRSRLYDLPPLLPERAKRGKTAIVLAREVGVKSREIPMVLRGLVNKGLAVELENPFNVDEPFYFRKVELAPVASS